MNAESCEKDIEDLKWFLSKLMEKWASGWHRASYVMYYAIRPRYCVYCFARKTYLAFRAPKLEFHYCRCGPQVSEDYPDSIKVLDDAGDVRFL